MLRFLLGAAILGGVSVWMVLASVGTPRADLVFVNGTDPASLDPSQVSGSPEGRILRGLFEGLTIADPHTLEPRPGVALSWQTSDDGCRWLFVLRSEARWSNGDRVTAHDFEWSWRRLLDPATAARYANLLWPVVGAIPFQRGAVEWSDVGIKALDELRLEVRLERPVSHLAQLTAFYPLFPVHRASVEEAERSGVPFTTPERLVSNGAFLLAERHLRDRIRLQRNPYYWDAAQVTLDSIDVLAVESENTALNLFLAGQADWIVRVPRALVPTIRSHPRWSRCFRPRPFFGTYFVRVNTTHPPFDDPQLRRALSLAIDRRPLVAIVTGAGEVPAWSFVPWPHPAIAQFQRDAEAAGVPETALDVPVPGYQRALLTVPDGPAADLATDDWLTLGHDPVVARSLLRQRGYRVPCEDDSQQFTAGQPFPVVEYLYNSNVLNERVAELLQAQWRRELGIEVRLAQLEWGSYLDATTQLEYQLARSSWIGDYLDPATFLEIFRGDDPNNRTGWRNPRYDQLLATSSTTGGAEQRFQLLNEAEALLLGEQPLIPLYYYVSDGMVAEGLRGLEGNALDAHSPRFFHWDPEGERPR